MHGAQGPDPGLQSWVGAALGLIVGIQKAVKAAWAHNLGAGGRAGAAPGSMLAQGLIQPMDQPCVT